MPLRRIPAARDELKPRCTEDDDDDGGGGGGGGGGGERAREQEWAALARSLRRVGPLPLAYICNF